MASLLGSLEEAAKVPVIPPKVVNGGVRWSNEMNKNVICKFSATLHDDRKSYGTPSEIDR